MSLPFRVEDSSLEHTGELPAIPAQPPAAAAARSRAKSFLNRLLPRTLTNRLVVGVVVLLVLLILVLSGGTYLSLRPFLYSRFDVQLNNTAQRFAPILARALSQQDQQQQLYPVGDKVWLGALDSDGRQSDLHLTGTGKDFAILNLPQSARPRFIAHPGTPIGFTSDDGEPLRVESIPLSNGNYALVGLSIAELKRTLNRLLLLEILIGASIIAIAAGVTSWGVRVGLRPLRRVTRTAQEVTAELGPDGAGLNRRVPVSGATVEVEEVAAAVNTLLHTVQTEFTARLRSEERMRQFLADASHELRTPLTSIRGYAELSRLQSASGEAADDSMRRIEIEGNRMSRLVEDLLVLARGDQGSTLRRDPLSVSDLLNEAADVVSGAYPNRPIEVENADGLIVLGDWDQLLRVLINLTTNAAVHTPSGPIRLTAEAGTSPLGQVVRLRVIDTGPGLTPEEAQHVFERFWRADKARSRAKGGSGLGMAIVAQIAHAHGGYVEFDSTVEHGTTVTVTLPVPFTADAPPALQTRQPG
ncbi:MAG TPA: HAMP domain-containing sensor histidine kinase [Jatrophihabitans sp.]|nr:HAMP domain-containing sensor histidine kinase [Jatrophihabitans sp.]